MAICWKAADRVRITGQLIDASTGAHLWAERFEVTWMTSLSCRIRSSRVSSARLPRKWKWPKSNALSASRQGASMPTTAICVDSRICIAVAGSLSKTRYRYGQPCARRTTMPRKCPGTPALRGRHRSLGCGSAAAERPRPASCRSRPGAGRRAPRAVHRGRYRPICASIGGHLSFHGAAAS